GPTLGTPRLAGCSRECEPKAMRSRCTQMPGALRLRWRERSSHVLQRSTRALRSLDRLFETVLQCHHQQRYPCAERIEANVHPVGVAVGDKRLVKFVAHTVSDADQPCGDRK